MAMYELYAKAKQIDQRGKHGWPGTNFMIEHLLHIINKDHQQN